MTQCDREYAKFDAVSKWHTSIMTVVAALALTWTALTPAHAQQDFQGAARIPAGGYLYTPDAPELTDAAEGLTVEVWLWLAQRPSDNAYANVIRKEGSYAVALAGRNLTRNGSALEPGQTALWYVYYWSRGKIWDLASEGDYFGPPDGRLWPMETWVHVAYQVKVDGEGLFATGQQHGYFNGEEIQGTEYGRGIARTDLPLYIAGVGPEVQVAPLHWLNGTNWRHRVESVAGWIDEVRVSRGLRYGDGKMPMRGEGPDDDTIALWTFDEGPGVALYPDMSENEHWLHYGNSLAVSPAGNLTTTWSQLKR